jgi:DNA-directed RNA polymerase subunit M/transcription elongation factor TFIIS
MGELMATTKLKALKKVKKNLILGYCPDCDCMIAMNDRETLTIMVCARCGYRGPISSLKETLEEEDEDLELELESESEVLTESSDDRKGPSIIVDSNDYESVQDSINRVS